MDNRDIEQNNTASNGQSLGMQSKNDFYHKHFEVSVISKKTEKIVTAIYMVTDFVPESEPLRTQLRTLGLSLIAGIRGTNLKSTEVLGTLEETLALMDLATTIGLVSEMNGTILIGELKKVKAEVDRHYGAKKVLFDESVLGMFGSDTQPLVFDKGQENSKGQNVPISTLMPSPVAPKIIKEVFTKKNDIGIKIARRNDVLNVVKSKGRASIKDVVSILKDISEKTVQRELLALVKEGVLAKEGEKRWSTYRVAS